MPETDPEDGGILLHGPSHGTNGFPAHLRIPGAIGDHDAIEVFAGAFAEDLRQQLYPVVEEMQGILGDLNDHAVAVRRLTEMSKGARRFHPKLWPLWRPGVNAYLSRQRRQLAVERRHFRKFWEAWVRKGVGPRFCAIVGESKTPTPRGPSEF